MLVRAIAAEPEKPLSPRERGWGEGPGRLDAPVSPRTSKPRGATPFHPPQRDFHAAFQPDPHPSLRATFSRREKGKSVSMLRKGMAR